MKPRVSENRAVSSTAPNSTPGLGRGWLRAGLAAFALVGGGAIFVVGSPYFELTPWNDNPVYNGVVAAGFGTLTLLSRRRPSLVSLRACSEALFVAATAMLVLVIGPFNWLVTLSDESYRHALQDKLAQFLAIVPVILLFTWLARRPWGWIYLQMGRPRRWLTLGLSTLVVGATVIAAVAIASGRTASAVLEAAPWIVAFAALNAVMEELWFRGIFLRAYTAEMGAGLAILVTAIIFGAAHVGATYVSAGEQLVFASLVVGLGVVLAVAMRWGDSLWGAVLVHITLDLVVVFELVDSV
jgi:membrane protease YdiL (CAAX protease family)